MDFETSRDVKTTLVYENVRAKTLVDQINKKVVDPETTIIVLSKTDMNLIWKNVPREHHRMIFSVEETFFSIIDSIMVPIHTKVDKVEVNSEELPVISSHDPVVRRLNFKIGDIIKIEERENGNIYHRIVK